VYAFWHFDDFSWGETRKIAGDDETNHDGHSTSKIMGNLQIPLKKWEEWERERRSFLYLNIKNQS
jgi:chitin synthase